MQETNSGTPRHMNARNRGVEARNHRGAPYYSLDGGTTNIAPFSTGSFNGDGRQASHWKDNLGLGIFDPTANPPGQINILSQLDLDAIDVIGYDLNLIPEPSTTLLTLVTLGFAARRRKR